MSRALLNAGADREARDGEGRTALHRARSEGAAAALLEAGANPNAQANDGGTVVHHIAREVHNAYMIIGALATAGADLDARDDAGDTALHVAVEHMNSEAALALIDGGANVWARDANGRTPLHHVRNTRAAPMLHRAVTLGRNEAVVTLLGQGADIEARNEWGPGALLSAAGAGKEVAVIAFVEAGADREELAREITRLLREAARGHAVVD